MMNQAILGVVLAAVLTVLPGGTTEAASLFNGGFETNAGNGTIPAGWSNIVNSYGASSFGNGTPHGGGWVLQPGVNFGSGGQYQDVQTIVGQPCVLRFFAAGWPAARPQQQGIVQVGTPGSDPSRLSLNNAHEYVNATNWVPAWTGPASWSQYGYLFLPTSALTRVSFQNVYGGPGTNSILIDDVSLEPAGPVVLLLQPQSQTLGELDTAVFTVVATNVGVSGPIGYQWYREGLALTSATNSVYSLPRVYQQDDGAQFHCVVSVVSNAVTTWGSSDTATLSIIPAAASLAHRYSFALDASDSAGSANGSLQGIAAVSGGALRLPGSPGAFLNLPGGLLNGRPALTVEFWASFGVNGSGARVFDFGAVAGSAGERYVFFTPHQGPNSHRLGLSAGGSASEQKVEGAGALDGSSLHVACVFDPPHRTLAIYTNGVLDSLGACTIPLGSVSNVLSYIGRPLNVSNAWLNASIDELRLYNSALSAAALAQSDALGPDLVSSDGPVSVVRQPVDAAVVEGQPVPFDALLTGREPYALQWFRDGLPVPGETQRRLSSPARQSDNGAWFQLWATNWSLAGPATAATTPARLTVAPDTNAPSLLFVRTLSLTNVEVGFSEAVTSASAMLLSHYQIPGISIIAAFLSEDGRTVTLTTSPLGGGNNYTLVLRDITDRATAANLLMPNPSITDFTANPFSLQDIGAPLPPGRLQASNGRYDLSASGAGIGGTNDQGVFAFENRTGDFDVQARLGSLGLSDAWACAGLMARNDLAGTAPFAGVFATPGPAGCFFQSRATNGAAALRNGSFPVNYPDTWLRLRRSGSLFSGLASLDGQTWSFLGAITLSWPATVQVGLTTSAANSNATTTASFTDYGVGSGIIVTNTPWPFEPMGPSSRRTALVFSEIMYNPPDAWGTNDLQFLEICNTAAVAEDLSGYQLKGDPDYEFPPGTSLPGGACLVVAKNPAAVQAFYGLRGVLGPFSGNLPNHGGTVRLEDELGGRLLDVPYDNQAPWPVAADGAGHSLVLRRPSYGEGDPRAWAVSDVIGGSPGRLDGWGREPLRAVVINEFLANSDPPWLDFVELYNAGNSTADLSGCWLSDQPGTNKFRIPDHTLLGPRGFLAFDEVALGFALDSEGEQIYLVNSNQTRVLDTVRFGAQAPNVSRGRQPDGAPFWGERVQPTPGRTNSGALARELVINELMYAPISGDSADEFIELYNRGTNSVDLAQWSLTDGISFTFSNSLVVPAGGYVVIGKDLTNLLARYTNLTTANTMGNYTGSLKNSGARLALQMPVPMVKTNILGQAVTNIGHVTINEVTYGTGGGWGQWSHSGGSSLELVDPRADPRLAANWADSDESLKAPWKTVSFTGPLCNGMPTGNGTPSQVEFFLQGPGECMVDDVECFQGSGANRVGNPGFENGATGWTVRGTQRGSFVQTNGGFTGKGLRLVATERGDTGANKVHTIIPALTVGSNVTLRAKVRWLKGTPQFLMRTRGNWLEATARLALPSNLGTPGLPNSRLLPNAGPAIAEVAHAPVTPLAGQPAVVSARLNDPDGIARVTLRYRLDPASSYVSVGMNDDGSGGDALAGDGVYSATIPGQTNGALVAFYLAAADGAMPSAPSAFPKAAPAHECLVRWGEEPPAGSFGAYRFWLTRSNLNFWTTREKNANDGVDCTFAYANSRAIYGVQGHYKGSPAHTINYTGPIGVACDYVINFPADDAFLGAADVVLGAEDISMPYFIQADNTAQVEVAGFWLARKLGQAYSHTRFVHLFFNGQRRATIYRDMQQPTDLAEEHFPGDKAGDLRKVEHWFEFDEAASGYEFTGASLERFNTPSGVVDSKRYRWNWRPRSTDHTDDFTNLVSAVLAANTPGSGPDYTSNVLAWIDLRNFLRPIAVHHIVGNWDAYAYTEGHNVYAYKPDALPWRLILWDLDFCLGSNSSSPPTDNLFTCNEPVVARMLNHPPFRREYLAAMLEAVNGPLAPGAADPSLDNRYACFQQNGVAVAPPASIKTYMAARRAYLLGQIPSANFRATGPATTKTNLVTLSGTAPLNVASIRVNGRALDLSWSTVTNWNGAVVVAAGTNQLALAACDFSGALLAATNLTVACTGTNAWPALRLNEWMASNTGFIRDPADNNTDDWFEIYNPTTSTVNLRGWSLTDTLTNTARFVVPADYPVPARGFLLVWADSQPEQNSSNRLDLHVNFKLEKNGEAIGLFAPDGTLIDAVSFGQQTNNLGQGRWPDGSDHLFFLSTPTPRGANVFTPPPPVILSLSLEGANGVLSFTTTTGLACRVDFKDELQAPAWTPLAPAFAAAASPVTLTNTLGPGLQRFYRVVLLAP